MPFYKCCQLLWHGKTSPTFGLTSVYYVNILKIKILYQDLFYHACNWLGVWNILIFSTFDRQHIRWPLWTLKGINWRWESMTICIPFITTLLTLKQTFKHNANTIRVVVKSDLPVEHQQQPVLPTSTSTSTTTCPVCSHLPDATSNSCVLFNVTDNNSHALPQHQQPMSVLSTTVLPASQSQYTEHLSHTECTPQHRPWRETWRHTNEGWLGRIRWWILQSNKSKGK